MESNDLSLAELRPTLMEVNLGALVKNFHAIRRLAAPAKIMAVVKANAYGHGLIACAKKLVAEGAEYLGVAFVEEGIELRRAGITAPILVFGGVFGTQIKLYLDHNLDITASSVSKLEQIEETAKALDKKARVHLKIDTGMERIGVHHYSASKLMNAVLKCKHCQFVGAFSHFARADESDETFSALQLERFLEVMCFFEKHSLPVPLRHIANSAGLMRFKESHLDMVRPGIALYGVYPESHLRQYIELQPVMTLKSKVVYFKVVKKDAGVSYGHRWTAAQDTRVITVPIGYGDGYFRDLSNRGSVLVRGKKCRIVGSVCMDQMMVDIGPTGEAYNGDEVLLVGEQGGERITVNEIADLIGTIPYEVLTSTNLRVPRLYV